MLPLLAAPSLVIAKSRECETARSNRMQRSDVLNGDDIPSLRGWFVKEKQDALKRSLTSPTNRRWFALERLRGDSSEEWALCYYKRSTADERCGWLFLTDVRSLSQDAPERWITIEHPTRTLRIQSPTPAQHRVWFSTLSKCCVNARNAVASPSSASERSPVEERRPARHSIYGEETRRQAKRNSLKNTPAPAPSTPKDTLEFLREITNKGSQESDTRKKLFNEQPSSSAAVPRPAVNFESSWEEAAEAAHGSDSDLVNLPPASEEKTEIEQFDEPSHTEAEPLSDQFDMSALKTVLMERDDQGVKPDIPKTASFTSSSRHISRSSSYQLHFGNEDDLDDMLPDDDFLCDWD